MNSTAKCGRYDLIFGPAHRRGNILNRQFPYFAQALEALPFDILAHKGKNVSRATARAAPQTSGQGTEKSTASRESSPSDPTASMSPAARRSGAWCKYRISLGQEFVVGGYTPHGNDLTQSSSGFIVARSCILPPGARRLRACHEAPGLWQNQRAQCTRRNREARGRRAGPTLRMWIELSGIHRQIPIDGKGFKQRVVLVIKYMAFMDDSSRSTSANVP
jgi:hypothetical protein